MKVSSREKLESSSLEIPNVVAGTCKQGGGQNSLPKPSLNCKTPSYTPGFNLNPLHYLPQRNQSCPGKNRGKPVKPVTQLCQLTPSGDLSHLCLASERGEIPRSSYHHGLHQRGTGLPYAPRLGIPLPSLLSLHRLHTRWQRFRAVPSPGCCSSPLSGGPAPQGPQKAQPEVSSRSGSLEPSVPSSR